MISCNVVENLFYSDMVNLMTLTSQNTEKQVKLQLSLYLHNTTWRHERVRRKIPQSATIINTPLEETVMTDMFISKGMNPLVQASLSSIHSKKAKTQSNM
jgi:hypothetical protein